MRAERWKAKAENHLPCSLAAASHDNLGKPLELSELLSKGIWREKPQLQSINIYRRAEEESVKEGERGGDQSSRNWARPEEGVDAQRVSR